MKGSSLETVRLAGSVVRRREGDRGCGGGALKEEEVGGVVYIIPLGFRVVCWLAEWDMVYLVKEAVKPRYES